MKKDLMYCKYCGKPLDKDAQFCTHCGKALTDNTQQPTAEPIQKTARTKNHSRRNIIIGIIAGLVLTAVCSPLGLYRPESGPEQFAQSRKPLRRRRQYAGKPACN